MNIVDEAFRGAHPFRRILRMTLLLFAVVVIMMLVVIRYASTAANNSDEVAKGNRIAACRAYANLDVRTADRRQDRLLLSALGAGDRAAFEEAKKADPPSEILRAQDAAEATYQAAVRRSVTDPNGFLRDCAKDASLGG